MSDFYGQHFTDRIVDGSLTSAREAPLASAENGHYPEPENSLQIATSSSIIGPSDHLNVAVFTYSMSEGNLSMVVNLSDDNAGTTDACVTILYIG